MTYIKSLHIEFDVINFHSKASLRHHYKH